MPTVFELFGLRFFFYSDDHPPIHVHVKRDDNEAKISVEPEVKLVYNHGLNIAAIFRHTHYHILMIFRLQRCPSWRTTMW